MVGFSKRVLGAACCSALASIVTGCDGIVFDTEPFYGIILSANIDTVDEGRHIIDIFNQHGLKMERYGTINPMTFSMYTETDAAQISFSVFYTGQMMLSIKQRRLGKSEAKLCEDLIAVVKSLDEISGTFEAHVSQENRQNKYALKLCAI